VAFYRATGIAKCYTLECNYNTSRFVMPTASSGMVESAYTRSDSVIYKDGPPEFTTELFEDLGKSVAISILDLAEKNVHSRLFTTKYSNLLGIRVEMAEHVATL
jgi:hypothetical protein